MKGLWNKLKIWKGETFTITHTHTHTCMHAQLAGENPVLESASFMMVMNTSSNVNAVLKKPYFCFLVCMFIFVISKKKFFCFLNYGIFQYKPYMCVYTHFIGFVTLNTSTRKLADRDGSQTDHMLAKHLHQWFTLCPSGKMLRCYIQSQSETYCILA